MGVAVKAGLFLVLETRASQIRRLFILAHFDKIPLLQSTETGTEQSGFKIHRRLDTDRLTDIAGKVARQWSLLIMLIKACGVKPEKDFSFQSTHPLHISLETGARSSIGTLNFNPNFSDWLMDGQ